jgi:hypothetical protein
MKPTEYKLVEHEGGYIIYKDNEVYETKLYTNIFVYDKSVGEVAVRKLNEGKSNIVLRYLQKFDRSKLIEFIGQTEKHDIYSNILSLSNNAALVKALDEFLSDAQLRKLIDAYVELGTLALPLSIATSDIYEQYDPFLSYYSVGEFDGLAEQISDPFYDFLEREVDIDYKYINQLGDRFNATMRPKSKKRQELMDEKWNACL